VAEREERPELGDRLALGGLAHPLDAVDGIHLVGEGPPAIGDDRIGRGAVGDADRVAPLAEQIDHRHAAQPQVLRAKGLQQARGVAVGPELAERKMKVQARRGPQPGRQCGQVEIEEVEFFGEAEVFGQMAVSTVGRLRHIDEGFVGRKADLTDKPVADRQPAAVLTFGKDLQAAQKERVPQRRGDRRLGIYIEADAAAGPSPACSPSPCNASEKLSRAWQPIGRRTSPGATARGRRRARRLPAAAGGHPRPSGTCRPRP
jgi:hypothetical protein